MLVITIFLLVWSTYIPTTINNSKDLSNVQFGFPLRFISQDYSDYIPNAKPPVNVFFSTHRQKNNILSTKVNTALFLINIAIVLALLEGLVYSSEKLYAKK